MWVGNTNHITIRLLTGHFDKKNRVPTLVNKQVRHTLRVQFAIILYTYDVLTILLLSHNRWRYNIIFYSAESDDSAKGRWPIQGFLVQQHTIITTIILVLWFNNACGLHRGDEKTPRTIFAEAFDLTPQPSVDPYLYIILYITLILLLLLCAV